MADRMGDSTSRAMAQDSGNWPVRKRFSGWRGACSRMVALLAALWLMPAAALAVSLGKIEVTSHLGEPFYAEVPLALAPGEDLANVDVGIASPADYRILEVYRDPALNLIRTDVVRDRRGARIELTSRSSIDSPFFNLVLKVRHQRATHFKKYPVFLDLPKSVKPDVQAPPVPMVSAARQPEAVGKPVATPVYRPAQPAGHASARPQASAGGFKPFDGWARISRYGPMVYGDTISTVAERLRVDDRFTLQQVMVALFEKNRAKFDQDNINLIKAGTYLDVPRAAEVERITPAAARRLIAEHEKRWAELKKQPRYAAVAEAQRTRYSKRVRMGKQASGVAAAPLGSHEAKPAAGNGKGEAASPATPAGAASGGKAMGNGAEKAAPSAAANAAIAGQLEALKKENEALQARLAESEKKIEALQAARAPADSEQAAALEARLKKLQLKLARMQAELDKARSQASSEESGGMDWLTMALGGLVVLLLGAVGFLLRREPKHPAEISEAVAPETPAAMPASLQQTPQEEVEEIEVEEADVAALEKTTKVDADTIREFTDSIPDLTDEDTGSMEPFTEDNEEEPDPNVDYLAEADVYMRYGMEDEALQQVNLAMRLNPEKADVHIKKAQVLRAKGDDAALAEAVEAARQHLAGAELEKFNSAFSELEAESRGEVDSGELEDTLPPVSVDETGQDAALEDTVSQETLPDAGGEDTDELDFDFGDAVITDEGGEDDTLSLDEALNEVAGEAAQDVPEAASEAAAPAGSAGEDAGGEPVAGDVANDATSELDFNLDDLEATLSGIESDAEAGGSSGDAPAAEAASAEPADDATLDFDLGDVALDAGGSEGGEDAGDESKADAPAAAPVDDLAADDVAADDAGGLDFDLSDIELPRGEAAGEPASAQVETADLEKTVAMDWSKDTSDLADLDLGGDEAAPASEAGDAGDEAGKDASSSSDDFTDSLVLDASDLGGDIEPAGVADEVEGDFTSTIRTTLDDIGQTEAKGDDEFTSTGSFGVDETVSLQPSDGGDVALDLDLEDDDADATQKLDSLLKEFTDDDDADKDKG